jgi:hypothetical protein
MDAFTGGTIGEKPPPVNDYTMLLLTWLRLVLIRNRRVPFSEWAFIHFVESLLNISFRSRPLRRGPEGAVPEAVNEIPLIINSIKILCPKMRNWHGYSNTVRQKDKKPSGR